MTSVYLFFSTDFTIIPENFHVKRFPNDRVAMPKKFSSVNLTFGGRNILL